MLEIRNLRKAFGDLQVLKGIDLDVNLSLIHISEPTRPY